MRRIKDADLKRFLFRWHKEYIALSQYTHVTMTKIAFAEMVKRKDMASQDPIKDYAIGRAISAINTSHTATATACLLIVNEVSSDYGAKKETREFWETLTGFSLLSKALWKMYVQKL